MVEDQDQAKLNADNYISPSDINEATTVNTACSLPEAHRPHITRQYKKTEDIEAIIFAEMVVWSAMGNHPL